MNCKAVRWRAVVQQQLCQKLSAGCSKSQLYLRGGKSEVYNCCVCAVGQPGWACWGAGLRECRKAHETLGRWDVLRLPYAWKKVTISCESLWKGKFTLKKTYFTHIVTHFIPIFTPTYSWAPRHMSKLTRITYVTQRMRCWLSNPCCIFCVPLDHAKSSF